MSSWEARNHCLKDKTSFQLIDLNVKAYASLPPRKLAQAYGWRKYALVPTTDATAWREYRESPRNPNLLDSDARETFT